jgi:hypothetical protein
MTENLPAKFLFLLVFIYALYLGYSILTANNMLELKTACEQAVTDNIKFASNKFSPEAKAAEAKMQITCKGMGEQSELYLKSLGLKP